MNTTAIAQQLNILDSAIIEIQEWANVLWVRFVGGCRFVSKKAIEVIKMPKLGIKIHKGQGQSNNEVHCELVNVASVFGKSAIALDYEIYSWRFIAYEGIVSDWGLKKRALSKMVEFAKDDLDLLIAVKALTEDDVFFA
jgi:hypothetical protein